MLLSGYMAQDSAIQQRMVSVEARKPHGGTAHTVPEWQDCGHPQHVFHRRPQIHTLEARFILLAFPARALTELH